MINKYIYLKIKKGFEAILVSKNVWEIPGNSEISEIEVPDYPQGMENVADIVVTLQDGCRLGLAQIVASQIRSVDGITGAFIVSAHGVSRPN